MVPPNLRAAAVPPPVLHVIAQLHASGHAAFLVGGCVRDMVRGVEPKDFDVATSALPEEVQRAFPKVIPTGLQHGTVTVVHKGHQVEVTTFRTEGNYLDGRRPSTVEFKKEIQEDLSRRDFTINAMAFDPDHRQLVDPFGGQADLQARLIRCVGTAQARFSEDGLRAMRAVRFATVLQFQIHEETLAAIPATLSVFKKVSNERIRVELEKLLLAPAAAGGLQLLRTTTLGPAFLPGTDAPGAAAREAAAARAPAHLEVRLAAWLSHLPGGKVRDELRRLTFPNRVSDRVGLLLDQRLPAKAATLPDVALRRWAAGIGLEAAPEGLELALTLSESPDPAVRARVTALIESRPPVTSRDLDLDGAAIMRILGVGPSRIVGEATRYLVDQVIEDPARNSASALEEILLAWREARTG